MSWAPRSSSACRRACASNAAGELVLRSHSRSAVRLPALALADRRSVGCSARAMVAIAAKPGFLPMGLIPDAIENYRSQHPLVSFTVLARDHIHAVTAVTSFEADVALVLQPPAVPEFQPLLVLQSAALCADEQEPSPDGREHRATQGMPPIPPVRHAGHGRWPFRFLLQAAIVPLVSLPVNTVVESDSFEVLRSYCRPDDVITFQIRAGLPKASDNLVVREIDQREHTPLHSLYWGSCAGAPYRWRHRNSSINCRERSTRNTETAP